MSWNVTKEGTKAELREAIRKEREAGHMPACHYVLLDASVTAAPEGRASYALSSNGSEYGGTQNLSLSLVASAAPAREGGPAVGGPRGEDKPAY